MNVQKRSGWYGSRIKEKTITNKNFKISEKKCSEEHSVILHFPEVCVVSSAFENAETAENFQILWKDLIYVKKSQMSKIRVKDFKRIPLLKFFMTFIISKCP